MDLVSVIAVFVGAGCGALLRWVLSIGLNPLLPSLPLGTLAANVGGGLLMGIALGLFSQFQSVPLPVRLALTTGFLGGLTTFSTFSAEATTLILRSEYRWVCAVIVTHVCGSLLATLAGIGIVRLFVRH